MMFSNFLHHVESVNLSNPAKDDTVFPSSSVLRFTSSPEGPTQIVKTTMSATSVGVMRCCPLFPLPVLPPADVTADSLRQLARHWIWSRRDCRRARMRQTLQTVRMMSGINNADSDQTKL